MFDSWVGKIYQLNMSSNDKLGHSNKIIRPPMKKFEACCIVWFSPPRSRPELLDKMITGFAWSEMSLFIRGRTLLMALLIIG